MAAEWTQQLTPGDLIPAVTSRPASFQHGTRQGPVSMEAPSVAGAGTVKPKSCLKTGGYGPGTSEPTYSVDIAWLAAQNRAAGAPSPKARLGLPGATTLV